jgi:hypothetical protein
MGQQDDGYGKDRKARILEGGSGMKWKTVGVLAVIVAIVMVLFGIRVEAETVSWTVPTSYTDNTPIPVAKQAQMSTEIQYRIPPGSLTPFGTATGGATSYAAPYVTPGGSTSYWRIRSISVADNNSTSAWSAEHPFVRGYQVPVAPPPPFVQ